MSTYFSATGENAALDGSNGLGGAGDYISLHSASPGTTGASEISGGAYVRVATTWSGSGGGSKAGSQVVLSVPSSTTVGYFGIWSAASAGTYVGGGTLPSSQTYAGAGTYALTPTLTATG
jgi:hypothetical protein